MSVEFENDQHSQSILYAKFLQKSEETPSLVNWLTSTGIVKTPIGANRILVAVMIISFFMTGYTVYQSFSGVKSELSPAEVEILQERLNRGSR